MKDFLRKLDLQDLQLVAGMSMLAYGLYSVYPPSAFIVIGSLLIAPTVLPLLVSIWRAK